MVRSLLIRGLLVGLVAGLAAFGFARWKGEPSVNKAIAFEDYVATDIRHEPHMPAESSSGSRCKSDAVAPLSEPDPATPRQPTRDARSHWSSRP